MSVCSLHWKVSFCKENFFVTEKNSNELKKNFFPSVTIFPQSVLISIMHIFSFKSKMQNTFRKKKRKMKEKENFWHHSNWETTKMKLQLKLLFPYYIFADAPVCTVDKTIIVGAFRSENLNVVCEVHADPPPRSFKWKFNSSGETYELSKERHYKNGSRSVLHYTPIMDQDFGTLTCIGLNDVGEQVTPCVFQVILAGEKFFVI